MGKLVLPKHSSDKEDFVHALEIYYNNSGWLDNSVFVEKLKEKIGDNQYPSSYNKKAQLPKYYGFVISEALEGKSNRQKITALGKMAYEALRDKNQKRINEIFMVSLENIRFGKENYGSPSSNSLVEAPNVTMNVIKDLGYINYQELSYILYNMNNNISYKTCVGNIKECREGKLEIDFKRTGDYSDNKPIMLLVNLGILKVAEESRGRTKNITFSEIFRKEFFDDISSLRIRYEENVVGHLNIINQINTENEDIEITETLSTEEKFRQWLSNQETSTGTQAGSGMVSSNVSALKKIFTIVDVPKYNDINSFFDITNINVFRDARRELEQLPNYKEINEKKFSRFLGSGLGWYEKFLIDEKIQNESDDNFNFSYQTNLVSPFSRNRILFGAPGTGKSFTLKKEEKELLESGGHSARVTFHPDYSYANFVGTYKPVPGNKDNGEDAITYKYVPGPFMRSYVEALKSVDSDSPKPVLLIIEEINRANVAAVFGDVFQLLDRDENNVSEYSIQASEEMKKYLAEELGGDFENYSEIKLPDNFFIWATMNSADQGVFPMDTAFKRRWDFTYLGINDGEDGIKDWNVKVGSGEHERKVNWNELRKAINNYLISDSIGVNEDKLMGPYFIAKSSFESDEKFNDIFKHKVLMYLFEDAAKHRRPSLFAGCENKNIYSEICREFDEKGILIFSDEIQENLKVIIEEADRINYSERVNVEINEFKKIAENDYKDE